MLVDVGGFSYKDAAEILDVPVGTVMSRRHRGRRLLKQALAEDPRGEGMTVTDPCKGAELGLQAYLDRTLSRMRSR